MLEQMNEEWFEQLDRWVTMLQEGKENTVLEEMHDLICSYEH